MSKAKYAPIDQGRYYTLVIGENNANYPPLIQDIQIASPVYVKTPEGSSSPRAFIDTIRILPEGNRLYQEDYNQFRQKLYRYCEAYRLESEEYVTNKNKEKEHLDYD